MVEKKNDTHILQGRCKGERKKETGNVAIAVNLYYEESMHSYLKYLSGVPSEIDVYIFSSNLNVLEELKDKYSNSTNIFILKKENRGRDISALLVAFKSYMNRYDYICFLHDKKEKYDLLAEDVEFWRENLWENMIFSESYIWNAIDLMRDEHYGVLLPPKPVGKYLDTMYVDCWRENYDNVVLLAQQLGLKLPIDREDTDVLAIGTVFWCNVGALKKLFSYEWTYEDFMDEPLPYDGTISHAIERIVGFVALDAGYKVGTIMNCQYAAKLNDIMQQKLEFTYCWMGENIGVKNEYQLKMLKTEERAVGELYKKNKKLFVYGAGFYGKMFLRRLKFWGYEPMGVIVSAGEKRQDEYCGYKVYELHEVIDMKDIAVIIAVGYTLQEVIADNLEMNGVTDYYKAVVLG